MQQGVETINVSKYHSVSELVKKLEHLGRLAADFDATELLELLKHKDENVRYSAVKNLAKLERLELLNTFSKLAENDSSSIVRKEAISAIGRLRNKQAKPILFNYLKDNNPEITLQAIRGLLVFKKDKDVRQELQKLKKHPNEIIKEMVESELSDRKEKLTKNHAYSPDVLKNVVVTGDVEEILKFVPSESVHLTFTSPPYYNARDYSIYSSYHQYLKFLERVFKEVYRITKEGRFFVLNTSPIIIPRVGRKYSSKRYPIPYDIHPLLVKMGWEFIDDIIWVKPEASVKNRNAGFFQHRKPLAYKPNARTENIMVYRKRTRKLLDWNIKQYPKEIIERSKINGDYESSNIWYIDPSFDKTHSAVFPAELCNRVIKFYSFEGDLVFDPFAGSGTVGKAAVNLKRYFFMTEKESRYTERIKENLWQTRIFSENEFKPKFFTLKNFIRAIKHD
jgi:DNA modification methylase